MFSVAKNRANNLRMNKQKAVFLDRDGTLIEDKHYLNTPDGVELFPDVPESLLRLHKAGYLLVVVTNQSGIARGLVTEQNVKDIHERLQTLLQPYGVAIHAFYHSPHAADSNHPLRKPNPGMLLLAAKEHRISLDESFMIGDKPLDVEAGHRAGTRSILISDELPQTCSPDCVTSDFKTAVDWILSR